MPKYAFEAGALMCLLSLVLLGAELFSQQTAAPAGRAAVPRCQVVSITQHYWEIAHCTIGTRECVTVAARSGSGTPVNFVQLHCFD